MFGGRGESCVNLLNSFSLIKYSTGFRHFFSETHWKCTQNISFPKDGFIDFTETQNDRNLVSIFEVIDQDKNKLLDGTEVTDYLDKKFEVFQEEESLQG